MTLPTLKVEVAWENDPFTATPTWTDVTAYTRQVSINRGKASLFDRMSAGTCSVVLNNNDGRFDPNNTLSPYAPYVLPMRQIRVTATHSAVTYGLFRGFLESVPVTYPSNGLHSLAMVSAVDGFKVLNLRQVTTSPAQELSSVRVANLLTAAGWPAGLRNIDTGQTTVQADTITDGNPLDKILVVADSELGLFYMDRDGKARFMSRHGLIGGTLDTTNYTFGTGGKPMRDPVLSFDDKDLWNEVKVSSPSVAEQVASDSSSQTTYGKRTLDKSALMLTSTTEQANHATFVLTGTKAPALRVDQMSPQGEASGGSWARILDRDLGSKIVVALDPPGSGDAISQGSYIEGISMDITPQDWRGITWSLVPMDRRADFWVLGDSVQSILGDSTRFAY